MNSIKQALNPFECRSFQSAVLVALTLMLSSASVFAQNGSRTWTGAVNGDFYNGGNWSAAGDFPNGNSTYGDNGTYATVTNNTITRSSGNGYTYNYGLFFNNTLGTQSSFTIGATPSSGTQINWGGPDISTATVTSGSLTDTINSNIAIVGGNATQYAKVITTGSNHDLIMNGIIFGGNTTDYSFTKAGSGKLTLSGDNTYDVVTTVSAGTLEVTHKNGLGSTTAGTVVNDGATLRLAFAAANDATGDSFTINGSGVAGAGALDVVNSDINGDITMGSNATINVTTRFDHQGVKVINGANNTLTKTGTGDMVRAGALNNTDLVVDQGKYLTTSSAASGGDTGSTITVNSGAEFSTWKNSAGNADLTLNDGSRYAVTSNTSDQVTSVEGTIEVSGAVEFNNWNHQHTINSDISGTGGITLKSTAGGQDYSEYTMTGTNTYAGTTTVGNGSGDAVGKMTLIVNGDNSGATGDVTVTDGSTLGGSGTIGGATTIQSGATLAAGNSPGLLTFVDDLTLDAGSDTVMEITGTTRGSQYDGIDVGGLLTYGGDLRITSDILIANGVYDLFGINGTDETGDFATIALSGLAYGDDFFDQSGDVWTAMLDGTTYTFSQITGDLTVVPEPGTYALLAGMTGLVYVMLRRRR